LWGSEQSLGPAIRGELTIDARSSQWRARIAGLEAPVTRQKDAVTFVLPANKGEFRGHLVAGANRIIGHWIQTGDTYPFNQRYATPVELPQVQPKVWKGTVAPLQQKVSFYVSIQRTPEGSLSAFIRNPEANFFRRQIYRVERNGSNVVLSREGEQLPGTYDQLMKSRGLYQRQPISAKATNAAD
jgi:hypothetical protein